MTVRERNNVHESGVAEGPPIVFVHGYGCDQNMWRFVAPAFEATHRVVLFDHVGYGGSDLSAWSAERYSSLDAYAADLVEIVDALDLRGATVVGHSVSAMVAVEAAIARPDRIGRLVLVGPSPRYLDDEGYSGGFSRSDIDELIDAVDSNYLGWASTMAPLIVGNADRPELGAELTNSFCRADPEVARQFARVTFLSDSRDLLAKVPVPTLVLQCREDVIAPRQVGEFVHDQIPGSELVVLDATGHCPNLSAPAETIAAIEAFL